MRMTDSEHGAGAADLLLVSLTRVEIWSEYRPRFLEIIAQIIDECDDDARSDPMALEFKKVYVAIQVWLAKLEIDDARTDLTRKGIGNARNIPSTH